MRAVRYFGTAYPPYFSEQSLHKMHVIDRKRDILLQKLDNEIEEPERQVYVEEFKGTHRRSIWRKVILLANQLLP